MKCPQDIYKIKGDTEQKIVYERREHMGKGILICGLNGAGKSTLGRALAKELHYHFIDNEDLYFPKTDPCAPYASPRSREEVETLLLAEITAHENFVFTSVKGDYGETVRHAFQYIVLLTVPREYRLERVKNRSLQKFGARALPGGELYEQEERFFDFVKSRAENTVEEWIQSMNCPVIRLDGRDPVEINVKRIRKRI